MKTIKKWLRGFNMKNVSSFFEITLAVAAIPLLPICLGVPIEVAYALMALFLIVLAILSAWKICKIKGI